MTDWQDRRIKTGYETAEELARRFNEANWRGHPESQSDAVSESLDILGWIGSVKVNIQSGLMFDGHLRVKEALVKDPTLTIPVDYYDLTPDEEALALQILDATTDMAEPIADKLVALMERTRAMVADKPGLQEMLGRLKDRLEWESINNPPPTLDQLENQYGDGQERDFWPYIKIQVSPETMRRWQFVIDKIPSDDPAQQVEMLLGAVDESLLGSV